MTNNTYTVYPGLSRLTSEKRAGGLTKITIWGEGRQEVTTYLTQEDAEQFADHLRSEYVEPWRDARVIKVTGCTGHSETFFRLESGKYVDVDGALFSSDLPKNLGGKIEVVVP